MLFVRKIRIAALGITLIGLNLTAHAETDFQQRLLEKYPATTGAKVEKAFPGFWSVIKNGEVVYFNEDLTILINGDVIDLETKQSITAALKVANRPKIDIAELNTTDAIKLGKGARRMYVFSDPDCPYCKRLENDLHQLQNVEIFIFPMPLASLHPNATATAQSIWCQKDKESAWRAYMESGKKPKAATCSNPIERNLELASKLHIMGTPAIIFADGSLFPGAMSAASMNEKLNSLDATK